MISITNCLSASGLSAESAFVGVKLTPVHDCLMRRYLRSAVSARLSDARHALVGDIRLAANNGCVAEASDLFLALRLLLTRHPEAAVFGALDGIDVDKRSVGACARAPVYVGFCLGRPSS